MSDRHTKDYDDEPASYYVGYDHPRPSGWFERSPGDFLLFWALMISTVLAIVAIAIWAASL
jgi:hypothetical protein